MSVQAALSRRARGTRRGIALAIVLAVAAYFSAKQLSGWTVAGHHPPVSPMLCAVLFGVAWRNFFDVDADWLRGSDWVTGALLPAGIALIGLRLTLAGMDSVVAIALPVVISCVATAVIVSVSLGRLLGLPHSLRMLIAAGTAICGCTAIVAVAPLVRARSMEITVALSCVVMLGSVGMLCYPWLAHAMFPVDEELAGVFLGTSIHDTSQVVGASLIYSQQFGSDTVAPVAALTKLIRNSTLLLFVPAMAWFGVTSSQRRPGAAKLKQVFPGFLLLFLALAGLRTAGDELLAGSVLAASWLKCLAAALKVSDFLLVCGMTAVALNVSLSELQTIGLRALCAALGVALAVVSCSLVLTLAAQRFSY